MSRDHKHRQTGVTLVELLVFIVIIGIALAGIVQAMAYTTSRSADPLRRKQALMIAEGLLEEVSLAKFTYCDPDDDNAETATSSAACATRPEVFGPEAGNARPFDNINDYVAVAGQPTAAFDAGGVLTDAAGRAMNLPGYSARLTITPAPLNDIAAAGATANVDVLRIRVEVRYDGNRSVVLDGYRTRYDPQAR